LYHPFATFVSGFIQSTSLTPFQQVVQSSISSPSHSHFAYNVISPVIIVHVKSNGVSDQDKYHHEKILFSLTGSVGISQVHHDTTLIEATDHFHHL
jgi:hypothetical protein